jgi:ubiquinone/menaquinone biosynthesis C-methylase UbiE
MKAAQPTVCYDEAPRPLSSDSNVVDSLLIPRLIDVDAPSFDPGGENVLVFRSICDLFLRYVSARPLAHALFRTVECKELEGLSIHRPVLDLGCGDGEFGRFALCAAPDVSVDLLRHRLMLAKESSPSMALAAADARQLPVGDGAFASVLAVSVLEHVDRPWEALFEIARVLRPGGLFVATIVLADLHRHLFHPQWLRPFCLARAYLAAHDLAFDHRCLLAQADWDQMISAAGLYIVTSRKIVTPRVTKAFDLLLASAWPYRLIRGTSAQRLWRPAWVSHLCWKLYQRLATEDRTENDEGSVLLIVAEKAADPSWLREKSGA